MKERNTFESREIGSFLKLKRMQLLAPDTHRVSRKRHRPYLTQQEIADRAQVSEVLVGQVEAGRYQNLNTPVLVRLCRALELSSDEEHYVLRLLDPPIETLVDLYPEVPAFVRTSVDNAGGNPSCIITPRFDVVYWNEAISWLMVDFSILPLEMRNVVVSMFAIPQMRTMWVDWENNAKMLLGGLRMMMSIMPSHRRVIQDMIDDMQGKSPEFAEWWPEALPEINTVQEKDLIHPTAGPMQLFETASQVIGTQFTIIQFTARDKATEAAMQRASH